MGSIIFLVIGIIAIFFGIIGLKEIKREPNLLKGGWMAKTGITIGILELVVPILFVLILRYVMQGVSLAPSAP